MLPLRDPRVSPVATLFLAQGSSQLAFSFATDVTVGRARMVGVFWSGR